jgi:hypothetical protein
MVVVQLTGVWDDWMPAASASAQIFRAWVRPPTRLVSNWITSTAWALISS